MNEGKTDVERNTDVQGKERTIDLTTSIAFSVLLKDKDVLDFLMRRNYIGLTGIIGYVISLGAFALLVLNYNRFTSNKIVALFLLLLIFTVIQPIRIRSKAKKQLKKQKTVNEPFQYYIAKEGILICQNKQYIEVKWSDVRKVVKTKRAMYLYLSTIRALILPKDQCANQWDELCKAVRECVKRES